MKNIIVCILIFIIIVIAITLFKKIDNDENKCGSNKKFKLNFDNHDLKCDCELDDKVEHFDTYGTVNFRDSFVPPLDGTISQKPFDKEVINIDSDKPFSNTSDYTNHMLCKKYYDHADKSAEDFYEFNYKYPITPLVPKGKITALNNNEYTSATDDTEDILDLTTVNDSYIFAY
jgi:hypothetical protein